MTVRAFGHTFTVLPGLAEDLITLEKEGAVYAHLWTEESQSFQYYRIPFLPQEIFQYVEAHVAQQQFDSARAAGATFEEAIQAITNPEIQKRVVSYGDYGRRPNRHGKVVDIRGCAASFYPPEIESLVCGGRRERYEALPNISRANASALAIEILDSFATVAAHLRNRARSRPPFLIEQEYDVQDLLFACVRSVFRDARFEEWTPKHTGSSKRIDIVIPSAESVVEVKFVRSARHAAEVADELKVDIESYHSHSKCKNLLILVWDPNSFIVDAAPLVDDLSGRRMKGDNSFDVKVLVRR